MIIRATGAPVRRIRMRIANTYISRWGMHSRNGLEVRVRIPYQAKRVLCRLSMNQEKKKLLICCLRHPVVMWNY